MSAKRLAGYAGLVLAAAFIATPAFAQYTAKEWPEGPMKQRFADTCGACHDINRIRVGYTPEGWLTVVRMMQNMEVPVPAEEWGAMTDYLIKNFPERKRPEAKIIPRPGEGDDQIVGRADARLAPARSARGHGRLDLVDRATRQHARAASIRRPAAIREFTLKTPHTGPHGLAEDKDGNIWFTGNNLGLIGKLDPKHRHHRISAAGPEVRRTRTRSIFDRTASCGSPCSRETSLAGSIRRAATSNSSTRRPKSRPYGLMINSKGSPGFVDSASTRSRTSTRRRWRSRNTRCRMPLAAAPARARPDDTIWYTDFARGMLGRLDLRNGRGEGMALAERSEGGAIRYRLHQGRALVRRVRREAEYDRPLRSRRRETFQSWAIPGGGDIVRNMDVAPNGNPVTAHSLSNQVGMVEIGD